MRKSGMKKIIAACAGILVATYLLLLIPERAPSLPATDAGFVKKQAFVWNQDAYWQALEAKYRQLHQSGCRDVQNQTASELIETGKVLLTIAQKKLGPDAPEFAEF